MDKSNHSQKDKYIFSYSWSLDFIWAHKVIYLAYRGMKASKGGRRKGQARRTWDKVYLYENVIMKVSTMPSKCAPIKKMLLKNKLRKP